MTYEWQPISESALWDLLNASCSRMSHPQKSLWEVIRIPPQKWVESQYGAAGGGFWAVAVLGTSVIWYNDIEDGFNRSSYRTYGTIEDYWCNQDQLECAIQHCIDEIQSEVRSAQVALMDSRILHIAVTKALSSVAWDKHGEHEYVIIGDGVVTDQERLQGLINSTFAAPVLWLSMGRHNSESIARSDAAREIVSRLKPKETVTVCDEYVRTFLQVLHLGIARTGVARSNYAFKRTASTHR